MKYFSVPADFKLSTLTELDELNRQTADSRVIEVYGQATEGEIQSSGRVSEVLPQADFFTLERYAAETLKKNIVFNYTLNPACQGNYEFSEAGIGKLKALLGRLHRMGITSVTVASPAMMELVKGTGLPFRIKASALCEIASPLKAIFYKEMGVERIVVDPDITRNFRALKNISSVLEGRVEIIINNVCFKDCAYKMFHYNHEAHCTKANTAQTIKDYFFNRCSMQKARSWENSIKLNWIRPEDLPFYTDSGVGYFKLQGRQNVLKGDLIRALKAYFEGGFVGNLFDLITIFAPYNAFQPYIDNRKLDGFVKAFFDRPDFCQGLCGQCNYCRAFAEKALNEEEARLFNKKALSFYQDYDRYAKEISKQEEPAAGSGKRMFMDGDLDQEFDL